MTDLHTQHDAIRFFRRCLEKAEAAETWQPVEVTITPFKDRVSRQQQKSIFGVIAPNLLAQEIENGNDQYAGWNPRNNDDVHNYECDMRTKFYYRMVKLSGWPIKIPVAKSLKFTAATIEEVQDYINKLIAYGDQLGVDVRPQRGK